MRRRFAAALILACVTASLFQSNPSWAQSRAAPRSADAAIILFAGQSNAGAGGPGSALLTAPVYPDRVFSFRDARQSYGTIRLDAARLAALGPVSDVAGASPFPATAMAEALAAAEPGTYFFHTAWYGGRPLGDFAAGSVTFANLVAAADGAVRLLRQRRLNANVSALVFIQGEAGPPDRATYAALLDEILDDALAALRSAAGQAEDPTAILVQTNTSNADPGFAADVALAQWAVAAGRSDVILAGPTYQLPIADKVHHSAEGRMMLGEMLALAYETRVLRGTPFAPLHPVGVFRHGARVVIDFSRPDGSLPLAFDERWVAPAPNRGFLVVGREPIGIADVSITGPSQVTLRLEADPGGPVTVRYAMTPSPREGWAPMRGQLYAPTLRRSHFAARGFPVPDRLAHYAIRFALRTD